jgi:hypothetical protein
MGGQDLKQPAVQLYEVLRQFVIPTLHAESCTDARVSKELSQYQINALAMASIEEDAEAAIALTDAWIDQGLDLDTLLVVGISGAARTLGNWWDQDEISFFDVTLGASRLGQVVLHAHSRPLGADLVLSIGGTCPVLLLQGPRSQHSLGRLVAAEVFYRHGWAVSSEACAINEDILDTLANHHIDLLGIGLTGGYDLNALTGFTRECRAISRNEQLLVMLGGPPEIMDQDLVETSGADFASCNAVDAQSMAAALIKSLPRS